MAALSWWNEVVEGGFRRKGSINVWVPQGYTTFVHAGFSKMQQASTTK